jgi:hypothetical protein
VAKGGLGNGFLNNGLMLKQANLVEDQAKKIKENIPPVDLKQLLLE